MSRKIYVEGNIIINTPYFKFINGGACFTEQPADTVIIPTNSVVNGEPTLEINEREPQSIFNEYYAKGELTSFYIGAEFLYKDYNEVFAHYNQRIEDIKEFINVDTITEKHQLIRNKLLFVSIIASVETFICDIILTKIVNDEKSFHEYFKSIPGGKVKNEIKQKYNAINPGHFEQNVIDYVLNDSYCNIKKISTLFSKILHINIDNQQIMNANFQKRHGFAHRNGRDKDGNYISVTNKELNKLINECSSFVKLIMDDVLV